METEDDPKTHTQIYKPVSTFIRLISTVLRSAASLHSKAFIVKGNTTASLPLQASIVHKVYSPTETKHTLLPPQSESLRDQITSQVQFSLTLSVIIYTPTKDYETSSINLLDPGFPLSFLRVKLHTHVPLFPAAWTFSVRLQLQVYVSPADSWTDLDSLLASFNEGQKCFQL